MKRFLLYFLFLSVIVPFGYGQATNSRYPIIPKPVSLRPHKGFYQMDHRTRILVSQPQLKAVADTFAAYFTSLGMPAAGYGTKTHRNTIHFDLDAGISSQEGYVLKISRHGISVHSSGLAGAFYAVQTLLQLMQAIDLPPDKNAKPGYRIPCCNIDDSPAYPWRGFHLDVSRHFFTKEYVFRIINWISSYKLNKLHLHLTDDQGWRVQLDQYPLLTEVGSQRTFNDLDSACIAKSSTNPDFIIDPRFIKTAMGQKSYGGFYTKDDIRSIIAYAKAHFIEVIPEIDMPGHMSAAIRAYPYLSCTGSTGWGKEFSYPICPSKEEVMKFSFGVWDEIAALFPSSYMHIGSDEVEKNTWDSSLDCSIFMQQHSMRDLKEIQNYFVKQVQSHLEAKGKKVIAWDDVIEGKVDSNLVMMYWRDWVKDSPARCAQNGNKIILTPWSPFYISGDHTDATFRNLYEYDPQSHFPPEVMNRVMGLQSCVWTEEIPSQARFEYLVFPRLQALSEVCWSKGRDWNGFKERLQPHLSRMEMAGIHYRKPDLSK